jgi:cell division FtsZ-interacting protein ZapD
VTGTVNQIEWAVQIKERVSAEFDRVAKALQSVAGEQADQDRVDTQAIIAILEEKRAEVMARTQAGYFIHDWQELSDQVRRMIVRDPRYLAIKSSKTTRRR